MENAGQTTASTEDRLLPTESVDVTEVVRSVCAGDQARISVIAQQLVGEVANKGYSFSIVQTSRKTRIVMKAPVQPSWPLVVGCVLLGLTAVFLMVIVCLDTMGYQISRGGKVAMSTLVGLTLAGSFGFIGGTAKIGGAIPIPKLEIRPIHFSLTGGIAGFAVGALITIAMFLML